VTSDARPDAHARLAALELGLPAIVGIHEDIAGFRDGQHIVMDSKRGVVFERPPALWEARPD
jgi:phosphohistidine swiveling domain-containing protein